MCLVFKLSLSVRGPLGHTPILGPVYEFFIYYYNLSFEPLMGNVKTQILHVAYFLFLFESTR